MVKLIAAKKQFDIQRVSLWEIRAIISKHTPRGHFLAKEGRKWVAVDNSTWDAWTEEFRSKRQAVRWLREKFEVGDRAKRRLNRHEKHIREMCRRTELG